MKKEKYYWFSFCDADRPPGQRFLGVVVLKGEDMDAKEAHKKTHTLGINPGGEMVMLTCCLENAVAAENLNRLLSKSEAEALAAGVER